MRLIVKELVLLSLTIVQARYIGYQGHGGYGGQGGYGNDYYYQSLDHYGPSNPFGSSSAGLALNPHYAYSKAAYQNYKYQQVKYAPYRSVPEFDFGHDENRGKHYCPADRPNYIREDRRSGVRNECVDSTYCGSTAYNPRDESCCPLPGQDFNFNTYQCELCPADGAPVASFNPSTQQCCPADRPYYIRVRNECVDTNFCGSTAYNPRDESCCPLLGQDFNFNTYQCESCPADDAPVASFNPSTQQCCPGDTPFYLRESNECLSGIVGCSLTAYIPGEEACCSSIFQFFNLETNQCEDCGVENEIQFNPFTQQCCPADFPVVNTDPSRPSYRRCIYRFRID